MISSAVVSSVGYTSIPSAFAVLMFTSSNLIGCSTGKSDGFALENLVRKSRGAHVHLSVVRSIGHKSASTSGLPRKADKLKAGGHVSKVP